MISSLFLLIMTQTQKAVVFWSGGKDSAMALYKALQDPGLQVVGLVTTVSRGTGTTSVHEISEHAIDRQALQTGLPVRKMMVEADPVNAEYEESLLATYRDLRKEGISTVIYGDIFLEDIKSYREQLLKQAGLTALFPLWKTDTRILMEGFIHAGFRAFTCCIGSAVLDESYLGRELDQSFIEELPQNVDPAGENGEFHTFCYDGPVFRKPVFYKKGIVHTRFAELKLAEQTVMHKVEYIEVL